MRAHSLALFLLLGLAAGPAASHAEAQRSARRASPRDPLARLLERYGEAREAGDQVRAERLLQSALRRAPSDARAALLAYRAWVPREIPALLALSTEAQAPLRRAQEALRRALDAEARRSEIVIEPGSERARAQTRRELRGALRWCQAALGEGREAIEAARAAATLQDAPSAALLRRLGALSAARGDLEGALLALEAARASLPQDPQILGELGALLLARGEAARAIPLFREALRRSEGAAAPRRDLAGALLAAGRGAEAIAELRVLAAAAPTEASPQLDLAEALAEEGQLREARAVLTEAARRAPEEGRLREALRALPRETPEGRRGVASPSLD